MALAALLCGGSIASAQGWEIGAKAGVSHSRLTAGQEFVWDPSVPMSAAFLKRAIGDHLSIQPEATLLRRVGVSTFPGSSLTLTADYLEFPLMLQLHVSPAAAVQPYLSAGPSLVVRLRCTLLFRGGGVLSSNDCDEAKGAQSNRIDVGVGGGAGLNVRIGATTLGIESRWSAGLRTNVLPIDVENARTLGWSVLAGASTPLSRRRTSSPRRPLPRARALGPIRDANIAAMLMAYANTDISYSRLVPRRSTRADVKDFARQMLVDHTKVNRLVNDLLFQLDFGAEDNITSLHMRDESADTRNPMYDMSTAVFDSAYVESEANFQREFLALVDNVLIPRARSAELRALLTNMRPTVAAHLANAERLRADVLMKRQIANSDTDSRNR